MAACRVWCCRRRFTSLSKLSADKSELFISNGFVGLSGALTGTKQAAMLLAICAHSSESTAVMARHLALEACGCKRKYDSVIAMRFQAIKHTWPSHLRPTSLQLPKLNH